MPASENKRYHNSVENIEELIGNFHNSVCTGPLYICTCCDQLWYKHSMCLADRISLVNPDIATRIKTPRLMHVDINSFPLVDKIVHACSNNVVDG